MDRFMDSRDQNMNLKRGRSKRAVLSSNAVPKQTRSEVKTEWKTTCQYFRLDLVFSSNRF